jgi:hypothetical protein
MEASVSCEVQTESIIVFAGAAVGQQEARVEAGQNTSTVAVRVVRGDEQGTLYAGIQLGHPVSGDINTGTWESQMRQ